MLLLSALIVGCNKTPQPEGSNPGQTKTTPVAQLPAEFYGLWIFQGSSGGIDGHGNRAYRVEQLAIREPNVIEEHRAGGSVTRDTFTAARGKSIFSTEDVWQIRRARTAMVEVLTLSTNGSLTVSENVYDGFSYSFERAGDGPGGP